ncbi:hypothetical protein SAMN04488000_12670 [Lentzea albida]|uniref:Uncharacterized protein n=1 Tax=Lentzea albida TaxID=65499 RepID=A0A1H9X125_9PSEU|nr:hypothetical protein SAMN04488000_12670 [Lentzea albida]
MRWVTTSDGPYLTRSRAGPRCPSSSPSRCQPRSSSTDSPACAGCRGRHSCWTSDFVPPMSCAERGGRTWRPCDHRLRCWSARSCWVSSATEPPARPQTACNWLPRVRSPRSRPCVALIRPPGSATRCGRSLSARSATAPAGPRSSSSTAANLSPTGGRSRIRTGCSPERNFSSRWHLHLLPLCPLPHPNRRLPRHQRSRTRWLRINSSPHSPAPRRPRTRPSSVWPLQQPSAQPSWWREGGVEVGTNQAAGYVTILPSLPWSTSCRSPIVAMATPSTSRVRRTRPHPSV